MLSPRAYRSRHCRPGLDDEESAKRETEIADKCIAGIRSTGDGTEKRPMIVTRSSDAYDVAKSLNKRVAGKERRIKEDKYYEILQCADKSELWFDVTAPFGRWPRPSSRGRRKKNRQSSRCRRTEGRLAPVRERETP